jgi:hypothetical protein
MQATRGILPSGRQSVRRWIVLGIFVLLGLLVVVPLPGCGTPVEVPNLQGLTLQQVKERALDSGFKLKTEFEYKRRSGNEVVMNQFPFPRKKISKGDAVTVQMADQNFETAIIVAEIQIQTANEILNKCRSVGIPVDDLSPDIDKARSLYDNAKTIEELVGPAGSTFFANTVINACNQRLEKKYRPGTQ